MAAGPDVAAGADRLLLALGPAIRLVLLEALSDAAAEITTALPSGSIETRLRGCEVSFVVEGTAPDLAAEAVSPDDSTGQGDLGDQVRLTLRLSEGLKARAEELSTELGQSLNAWLVDTVRGATTTRPPGAPWPPPPRAPRPPKTPGRHQTGWA